MPGQITVLYSEAAACKVSIMLCVYSLPYVPVVIRWCWCRCWSRNGLFLMISRRERCRRQSRRRERCRHQSSPPASLRHPDCQPITVHIEGKKCKMNI